MSKYSLKNIALGIGIGLVISSFANINAGQRQLTVEEFKREADRLGYYVVDMKEMIKKNSDANSTDQAKGEGQGGPALTPVATPVATPAPTPEVVEIIEVRIKRGSVSDTVAEALLEKGLIENRKAFLNKLFAAKKSSSLQYGRFLIPKGAAIEDIILILTSPPNG